MAVGTGAWSWIPDELLTSHQGQHHRQHYNFVGCKPPTKHKGQSINNVLVHTGHIAKTLHRHCWEKENKLNKARDDLPPSCVEYWQSPTLAVYLLKRPVRWKGDRGTGGRAWARDHWSPVKEMLTLAFATADTRQSSQHCAGEENILWWEKRNRFIIAQEINSTLSRGKKVWEPLPRI